MIGFEPGNEQRTPQDEKRFNLPGYLQEAALDEAYATKDHTHPDQFAKLDGIEAGADKTDLQNVVGSLNGLATATPVDATVVFGADRKWTWATIKATLKTYFDGIYQAALGFTPANKAGDTFTGSVGMPQWNLSTAAGNRNGVRAGTGDGASYSTYNMILSGWWGMGMETYDGSVKGFYDFRNGSWDTKGGFFKNGVEAFYTSGGTISGSVTVTGTSQFNSDVRTVGNHYFGNSGTRIQGSDGNIYLAWAGDWLNNILGNRVTKTGDTMSGVLTVTPGAVINGTGIFTDSDPQGAISYGYESLQLPTGRNLRIYFGTTQRYLFEGGGNVTLNTGGLYVQTELGIGAARVASDGNVYGSMWGNQWLSTYLTNRFNGKADIGGAVARLYAGNNTGAQQMIFNWSGQGGQPSWLWGGNDGTNMYVWNPSNFSVNYANSAGNANTVNRVIPSIVDVRTSRATNTVYLNNTGRDMFIAVNMANNSLQIQMGSDGSNFMNLYDGRSSFSAWAIIPQNWYYRVQGSGVNVWYEAR